MNAGARHALSIEEITNKLLKVSIDTGLAPDQIKLRQEKFGPNTTMVTHGRGVEIVVSIGDDTETGKISELMHTAKEIATPLTRKLNKFSKLLLYVIAGLAAITFVDGLI